METDRVRSNDPLVTAVLTAAAAPAEAPLPGEAAALAAFRRAYRPSRRERVVHSLVRAKIGALAVAGGVVLASGVATAATGNLPVVSSVIGQTHSHSHSHSGGTRPNSHSGTHPSTRGPGTSEQRLSGGASNPTNSARTAGETASGSHGNGAAVSQVTATTTATGVDKGQAVCSTASSHKCQAGTHAPPADSTPSPGPTPHGSPSTSTIHRSTSAQPHIAAPTRP